jgi:hypothetical protein
VRIALLILLLGVVPLHADEPAWSPVVRGLQARLFTAPHTKDADYTYDVWIAFRNVGTDNLALGQEIKVAYGLYQMNFTVTDAAGNQARQNVFEDMRMIASYPLMLPPSGCISFPIGSGGGTTGNTGPAGRLLSFDRIYQWSLPPQNGPYRLAATYSTEPRQPQHVAGLTIVAPQNARPVEDPLLGNAWRGKLQLPAISLPQ